MRMVLPALALLVSGRICDILLVHPTLRQSSPFGLFASAYEVLFASLGNVADVIGILFLILGFAAIIRHERSSAQLIDQLETILPICSYCKKCRTESNEWLRIEKYLKDNSGRKLIHGICPECYAKIGAEFHAKLRA